jgi:PAS domain S-box-containing protein
MLIMDNFFVFGLLFLSGGLNSPYFFFLGFMIITAAYWYGLKGLAVMVVVDGLASLALLSTGPSSLQPTDIPRTLLIKLLTLAIIGVLAERLTHAERQERFFAMESNQEVEAERQRLMALINSLADAAVAVNSKGAITLYNGATLDLLNTNQSLMGKLLAESLPLIDGSDVTTNIMTIAAKTRGNQKRDDLIFLTKEGTRVNLDISIAPIYTNQGGKQYDNGYVMIMRDITKDKTLEQQRDEFISVASHELRTPLAIAEANISTAMLPSFGKIDPKAKGLLEQAHQNIVFLGDLIKDLTTLSRIEQGNLSVDMKLIEPAELLDQLARDYRSEIETKGLELDVVASHKLVPVLTSEYRVHEILQNFITNAIKYTQKGTITLSAEPAADDPNSVLFSVKDSGIGIASTDKKHLFTKFFRSEDYRTRQTGGTGLGLYITKSLAERLNAKIWYDSKLNKGSTFYLQVPPFSKRHEDHKQVTDAQMDNFVASI